MDKVVGDRVLDMMQSGRLYIRVERVFRVYVSAGGVEHVVEKRVQQRGREGEYLGVRLRFGNSGSGRRVSVAFHVLVWMWYHNAVVPEGCEIHHVDFDCTNNEPWNLKCLTVEEHRAEHRSRTEDMAF